MLSTYTSRLVNFKRANFEKLRSEIDVLLGRIIANFVCSEADKADQRHAELNAELEQLKQSLADDTRLQDTQKQLAELEELKQSLANTKLQEDQNQQCSAAQKAALVQAAHKMGILGDNLQGFKSAMKEWVGDVDDQLEALDIRLVNVEEKQQSSDAQIAELRQEMAEMRKQQEPKEAKLPVERSKVLADSDQLAEKLAAALAAEFQTFSQGKQHLKAGQYDEAVECFSKANIKLKSIDSALVPKEVMNNCKALLAFSLYGKGKGLMDKHEFDQAALCFTNALDVCPPSVDKAQLQVAFTYRAYCLYCSGRESVQSLNYATAIAKFKDAQKEGNHLSAERKLACKEYIRKLSKFVQDHNEIASLATFFRALGVKEDVSVSHISKHARMRGGMVLWICPSSLQKKWLTTSALRRGMPRRSMIISTILAITIKAGLKCCRVII